MRAIGYARVSTEEQARHGISLEVQVKRIKQQAEIADYDLQEIIIDAGCSAKSFKRTGIQSAIQAIKAGEVEAIIIYRLDRLTRSVTDLDRFISLINKYDVALASVTDSIDTKTATGRMTLNIIVSVMQGERELIGERTAAALQLKRERGEYCGGVVPFGYRRRGRRLVEVEEEQRVCRIIARKRRAGASLRQIAAHLERLEVKTKTGGKWYAASVRQVLNRKVGNGTLQPARETIAA